MQYKEKGVHKETLGSYGYVHYLNHAVGFMNVYTG